MSEERIAGYRNFVNKIWNAARFTLMNLEGDTDGGQDLEPLLEDRWILSRAARTAKEAARAIEEYRFNDAASALYQFTWHEFCDWYLECIKPPLYNQDDPARQAATRRVLREVFARLLVMLHPFMPFVTEELWQRLPGAQGSVMKAPWPSGAKSELDPAAQEQMGLLMEVIGSVRNIRGEMGISPGQGVDAVVIPHDQKTRELLISHGDRIQNLAKVENLKIAAEGEIPPKAASAAVAQATVYVPLEGLVDFKAEEARLQKGMAKLEKELNQSQKKLSNQSFVDNAPPEVVEKEKSKLAEAESKLSRVRQNLERVRSFL